MLVRDLLQHLFDAFPAAWAESWDHVGLSVGDPNASVRRIMVSLDATEEAVRDAVAAGADVLVCHHPVYLDAPATFAPCAGRAIPQSAAAVYEAARSGVSVISFHTNLDRAPAARCLLPQLLGLTAGPSIEHPQDDSAPGLGALCSVTGELTLFDLACRCREVFAVEPRVWGEPASSLRQVATLGGSLGHLGEDALAAGADAIVCGEAGYHVCQDLAARGCGIVLLGHDVSEFPFVDLLRLTLLETELEESQIVSRAAERPWWTPIERACDEHR